MSRKYARGPYVPVLAEVLTADSSYLSKMFTALKPLTAVSCHLTITNGCGRSAGLSCVCIQCSNGKKMILTCAHYFGGGDTVIAPISDTDRAEARSLYGHREDPCKLRQHNINADGAFVGLEEDGEDPDDQFPSVPSAILRYDFMPTTGTCFTVGFNSGTAPQDFEQEAEPMSTTLGLDPLPEMPAYLHVGKKVIGAGRFEIVDTDISHNIPGWFGISGALTYAFEGTKPVLVCLCKFADWCYGLADINDYIQVSGGRLHKHRNSHPHLSKACRNSRP